MDGLGPLHRKVVDLVKVSTSKHSQFLDIACGDGEPACSLARTYPEAQVNASRLFSLSGSRQDGRCLHRTVFQGSGPYLAYGAEELFQLAIAAGHRNRLCSRHGRICTQASGSNGFKEYRARPPLSLRNELRSQKPQESAKVCTWLVESPRRMQWILVILQMPRLMC